MHDTIAILIYPTVFLQNDRKSLEIAAYRMYNIIERRCDMHFDLIQTMWQESEDFELYRENIGEQYIFIHFLTHAAATLCGNLIKISPSGCVFFERDRSQYIKADGTRLVHDWFHAKVDCAELMQKYNIKCEHVYYPQNSEEITRLLSEIELEYLKCDKYYEQAVDSVAEKLFISLARSEQESGRAASIVGTHKDEFILARQRIHSELSRRWTIDEMSRLVNLSPSRFMTLYRQLFATTPQNDLINKRIQAACGLLTNENCTVERAALQTGYTNTFHFIRQFKRIIGKTPGEYKRESCQPRSKEVKIDAFDY